MSAPRMPPKPSPRTTRRCAGSTATRFTQLEFARAGIITRTMIYVAERENLGRKQQLERAEAALADGESSARRSPPSSPRNSSARRSRAAAPSSPPTSTMPSSSR